MSFQRVAIIGLGLLGGSIGLAVRAHLPGVSTAGYDFDSAARTRGGERGLAPVVDASRVGAALDESPHRLGMVVVRREDEQRVARPVGEVHGQPGVQVGRQLLRRTGARHLQGADRCREGHVGQHDDEQQQRDRDDRPPRRHEQHRQHAQHGEQRGPAGQRHGR